MSISLAVASMEPVNEDGEHGSHIVGPLTSTNALVRER